MAKENELHEKRSYIELSKYYLSRNRNERYEILIISIQVQAAEVGSNFLCWILKFLTLDKFNCQVSVLHTTNISLKFIYMRL